MNANKKLSIQIERKYHPLPYTFRQQGEISS